MAYPFPFVEPVVHPQAMSAWKSLARFYRSIALRRCKHPRHRWSIDHLWSKKLVYLGEPGRRWDASLRETPRSLICFTCLSRPDSLAGSSRRTRSARRHWIGNSCLEQTLYVRFCLITDGYIWLYHTQNHWPPRLVIWYIYMYTVYISMHGSSSLVLPWPKWSTPLYVSRLLMAARPLPCTRRPAAHRRKRRKDRDMINSMLKHHAHTGKYYYIST